MTEIQKNIHDIVIFTAPDSVFEKLHIKNVAEVYGVHPISVHNQVKRLRKILSEMK